MNRTLGILGGMGPMAGVHLQQLIIEYTPSRRDQDHIPVVTYTLPQIPDRTEAVQYDRIEALIHSMKQGIDLLVTAGVASITIPCNTAHVIIDDLQAISAVPIENIVSETCAQIKRDTLCNEPALLLATHGTYELDLYRQYLHEHEMIEYPSEQARQEIMRAISDVKAGNIQQGIHILTQVIDRHPHVRVILGCTELSLLHDQVASIFSGRIFFDPLRLMAKELVHKYIHDTSHT